MNEIEYQFATASEDFAIKEILKECELHSDDIQMEMLKHFILAKDNNNIIGMIGLEIHNEFGLLRSFCVRPSFRGKSVGKNLIERFMSYAVSLGIREIFLLTTTAEKYFVNCGFLKIEKHTVPKQIKNTTEFKNICPDNAVCLYMKI